MRTILQAAVLAAVLASPAVAADKIVVEAIQVRMLQEGTGALSRDIAAEKDFGGFNLIIGGEEGGPVNDLLVTVVLKAPGEANGESKLVVTARGKDKKVLATRSFDRPFVGASGKAHKSLLVPDATCSDVEVTAVYGKLRRQALVRFNCGE